MGLPFVKFEVEEGRFSLSSGGRDCVELAQSLRSSGRNGWGASMDGAGRTRPGELFVGLSVGGDAGREDVEGRFPLGS